MKRRLVAGAAAILVGCAAMGTAWAQEGGEVGPGRRAEGAAGRRERQERDQDPKEMARRAMMPAVNLLTVAAELPEAKATCAAYLQEVAPLMEETRNIHRRVRQAVRQARQDGATQEEIDELLKQGRAEVAEAQKKLIPMQVAFCKALCIIAEQHPDKVAAQLEARLAERRRDRGDRPGPRGPRPRGGRDRDANEGGKDDRPVELD